VTLPNATDVGITFRFILVEFGVTLTLESSDQIKGLVVHPNGTSSQPLVNRMVEGVSVGFTNMVSSYRVDLSLLSMFDPAYGGHRWAINGFTTA
jgi:hypothetical protein